MTRINTLDTDIDTDAAKGGKVFGARELTDSAVAALDSPGSMKVSSILMQDTVAAGAVSVAPGLRPGSLAGRTALFANPYLDGKEEALAVDGSGNLTYLQRDAAETGWLQTDVTADGKVVKAREVVVVVHPQDMSVWAIYSPDKAGAPQALRLQSTTVADGTACRWEARTNVIAPVDPKQPPTTWLSHLHVYYQDRTPIITAMDATGHVVTIAAAFGNLTTDRFGYTVHPGRHPR